MCTPFSSNLQEVNQNACTQKNTEKFIFTLQKDNVLNAYRRMTRSLEGTKRITRQVIRRCPCSFVFFRLNTITKWLNIGLTKRISVTYACNSAFICHYEHLCGICKEFAPQPNDVNSTSQKIQNARNVYGLPE